MTTLESNQCVYGQWLSQLDNDDYEYFLRSINPESGLASAEIHRLSVAGGFDGGLTSVKAHRNKDCKCHKESLRGAVTVDDPYEKAIVTASQDEITVENVILTNALEPGETGIFDHVFKIAKLNKEDYRLVDDSLSFGTWNQSAMGPDGERNTIVLYSYRCRFVRVTELQRRTETLVNELAEAAKARRRKVHQRTPGTGLGVPASFTLLSSDWQLGKPEIREQDLPYGKTGVEQTIWRVERGVERSVQMIKDLRKLGHNIPSVSIGLMGDPTENISDSYTNQQYTVELNLIDQIERAVDLMEMQIGSLLEMCDEPGDVFGVLCNHGQMARKGTKTNVTDDADNVQNLLLRLLRDRIIGPAFPGTNWYLPGDQMITTLNIQGVAVSAAHGHKIPSGISGEKSWLASQTANLADKRGHQTELWLTAHRHSHEVKDYGPYFRLQAATADGGSKHFEDGTGMYSTPGTSVALIGRHDERKYSHFELL